MLFADLKGIPFVAHVQNHWNIKRGGTMREKKTAAMFSDYPDVVTVKQLRVMLGGIGMRTAYSLLENGSIRYLKIGKSFKIPKISVIEYLLECG